MSEKWITRIHTGNGKYSKPVKMASVIIKIRCNETGEIRSYEGELFFFGIEDEDPSDFYFSEGNYSCDCNRLSKFMEINGEEYKCKCDVDCNGVECPPCGDEAYDVQLINKKDGEIFYDEFDGREN